MTPHDVWRAASTSGWSLWEALFERTRGPRWQERRHRVGHGNCDYCSGRISTPESRALTAKLRPEQINEKGSCAL